MCSSLEAATPAEFARGAAEPVRVLGVRLPEPAVGRSTGRRRWAAAAAGIGPAVGVERPSDTACVRVTALAPPEDVLAPATDAGLAAVPVSTNAPTATADSSPARPDNKRERAINTP